MNNGIKPTRLWRLTGKKHFQKIMADKHNAVTLVDRGQIPKLKLLSFIFASVAGISYSYGKYSEPGKPRDDDDGACQPVCDNPKRDLSKEGPCPEEHHKPIPHCPPSQCVRRDNEPRTNCITCKCPCKKKIVDTCDS